MDPSMDTKKPLRARKTMTPSSRKQVEMLSKMKCTQGAEEPSNGASSEGHNFPLKRVETNCLFPTSVKQLDLKQTQLVPQMLKEPVANLLLNSKISIYNDRQELSKDLTYNPCGTDSDVKQFLNAGALQDILYSWYEKESSSPLFKPVEVHLNSKPESQPAEHPRGPFEASASPKAALPAVAKAMEETLVDQSTPELEQESATIQRHKKTIIPSVQPDYAWGKRRHSESSENAFCKHIKTSDDAREACEASSGQKQRGLEKVRSFIQSQMDASMEGLDHHLQRLRESIDRTQCLRKHEDIAIKIVKRISRLDRRINTLIAFQKTELSRKASCPGASVQNETPNRTTPPPGKANSKAVPPNPSSTKGSDDVVCVDLVNKNSGVEAVNTAGVQRKGSSTDASTVAETSSSSKDLFLIDLTDESSAGQAGKEKEKWVAVRRPWAAEHPAPVPPPPSREGANEVLKEFSHLPPLPKVRARPEHTSEFQNTLPPQKLELAVAQVQNPKGIALQWNVRKEDPRCAPIESFHLFICLEGPKTGAPSAWMETNKIKALPLPMACSLSRFPGSARCYFVMQSRDIYGRYGPFCDIQAISPV